VLDIVFARKDFDAMKVYLIRHAQSTENAIGLCHRMSHIDFNKLLYTSREAPLTLLGIIQSQKIACHLANTAIDRLYTSPFTRARETALFLGKAQNVTPHVLEDLREIMPVPIKENSRESYLSLLYIRSYLRLLFPNVSSESLLTTYRRAKSVWQTMTQEPAEGIAIVSHCAFLQVLLLHIHFQKRWRIGPYNLKNGGITCVWNDTSRCIRDVYIL
jgi:broad specificity phosphatase PhoE